MTSPARAKLIFGWLLAMSLGVQVGLSLQLLTDYSSLVARLWGQSLAVRGFVAADEHRNVLGQAGHLRLRAHLKRNGPTPGARRTRRPGAGHLPIRSTSPPAPGFT